MRLPKFLAAAAVNLCLAPFALADVAQVVDATIISGDYKITPSFCAPEFCKTTVGKFKGTFTATLVADHVFFSNIKITSDSDNFTLPEDPYSAPPGATASAKYSLKGNSLVVDGFINSTAFDGPLVEYHIDAQTSDTPVVDEPFNPHGYFLARQDFRKCAAPLCGGIFIKKVNQPLTQCPDGRKRAECYVGTVNWDKLGFNPFLGNSQLLVQGKVAVDRAPGAGKLGTFYGVAAYRPANDSEPEGVFFGVEDAGIRCITSPCFSLNEYKLNSDQSKAISDLDLTSAYPSDLDLAAAYNLLGEGEVVPVVGKNSKVKQLAGIGVKLTAQNFYLPVAAPEKPVPQK